MRALLLAAAAAAFPAQADLYRWIDPDSGSVKFSSLPPPWYGDPARERRSPRVEVLRSEGAAAARAEPERPVAAPASRTAELQARRRALQLQLFALERPALEQGGEALERRFTSFQEISAELDRLDPEGAEARKAEDAAMFEALRSRFAGAPR